MATNTRLTAKQQAFAINYALTGNALQSARDAGYTENTAIVHSHKWLDNLRIKQAIERHKQQLHESGEKENMTPEWIMHRAKQLASQDENPSAAVAALRLGADVQGMLGGGKQDMPASVTTLLDALAQGISAQRAVSGPTIEARVLPSSSPVQPEQEPEG